MKFISDLKPCRTCSDNECRLFFYRGVLPPTPKRRLVPPQHSINATKAGLGTRPNSRRIAANATVCQIAVQQTPCKR